jgi:hypothetical protein
MKFQHLRPGTALAEQSCKRPATQERTETCHVQDSAPVEHSRPTRAACRRWPRRKGSPATTLDRSTSTAAYLRSADRTRTVIVDSAFFMFRREAVSQSPGTSNQLKRRTDYDTSRNEHRRNPADNIGIRPDAATTASRRHAAGLATLHDHWRHGRSIHPDAKGRH